MKIIRNKFIPFSGYKAINLFGVLFVRNNAKIDDVTMNHEKIHTCQFIEVLIISLCLTLPLIVISWWIPLLSFGIYYIMYVLEWLIKLPKGNAYRRLSFEREAYTNQSNMEYLKKRKAFAFFKYY